MQHSSSHDRLPGWVNIHCNMFMFWVLVEVRNPHVHLFERILKETLGHLNYDHSTDHDFASHIRVPSMLGLYDPLTTQEGWLSYGFEGLQ